MNPPGRRTSCGGVLGLSAYTYVFLKKQNFPFHRTKNVALLLNRWRNQERGFESTAAGDIVGATSIQINRNFESRLHVDGNNLSPSDIQALGNWETGGELWVEAPPGEADDSERDLVLGSGFVGGAATRTPGIYLGRHVNVHGFFQFDESLRAARTLLRAWLCNNCCRRASCSGKQQQAVAVDVRSELGTAAQLKGLGEDPLPARATPRGP